MQAGLPKVSPSARLDKSDVEIARLGVVQDDRGGRLLGVELVLVGQLDADPRGVEQREQLALVGEVGAGGVAEGVARAAVALLEQLVRARARRGGRSRARRGCACGRIRPAPRPARRRGRAGGRSRCSGRRRTMSRATSEARWPTVTTCRPITSRSGSAASRRKSAMHRPFFLAWRGSAKRATSRAVVGGVEQDDVVAGAGRGPVAVDRLRREHPLAPRPPRPGRPGSGVSSLLAQARNSASVRPSFL